jgi:adenosylcobinamide-GDP ribazoletransferase
VRRRLRSACASAMLSAALFSVLPAPATAVGPADRARAIAALAWLPAVGGLLGVISGLAALPFWHGHHAGSPLLGALICVTAGLALTRGLHADGLADVADGLGSAKDADGALAVMRRSDIGPFGVLTLLLSVGLSAVALAEVLAVLSRPQGVWVAGALAGASRLAAVQAARHSVPSARSDGFGALVAGGAGRGLRVTVVVAFGCVAVPSALAAGVSVAGCAWLFAAVLLGQSAAAVFSRHLVRRLGGVTGDVFGALIEVSGTVTLLALAGFVGWGVRL